MYNFYYLQISTSLQLLINNVNKHNVNLTFLNTLLRLYNKF